jgi:hypothetical protein
MIHWDTKRQPPAAACCLRRNHGGTLKGMGNGRIMGGRWAFKISVWVESRKNAVGDSGPNLPVTAIWGGVGGQD